MGCDSAHGTIMSLAVVVVVIVGCSRMRWNADARLYTACQQIGNDVSQGCLWYLALANACLSPRPAMQFLQRDLTHLSFQFCCIIKNNTISCCYQNTSRMQVRFVPQLQMFNACNACTAIPPRLTRVDPQYFSCSNSPPYRRLVAVLERRYPPTTHFISTTT